MTHENLTQHGAALSGELTDQLIEKRSVNKEPDTWQTSQRLLLPVALP